ncbi:redoxin domain-containing protein [Deinococcus sp.]|uniref:TlpA family protein disulfide reductase n=1 Tax=Deinococcus sp. TaxID=47478 RepID=UPI0025FB39D0|nr:redoxin domain-containing protein [Deinococcus sp.]
MTSTSTNPVPIWRRVLPPVLALVLVGTLGAALLRPRSGGDAGDKLLGKPAPTFALATLDGGQLSSAQLRGQPLLLNFWASWCVPCRDEAPLLRELSEKQSGKLRVVGVLFDDKDKKGMRKFIADYGLSYPNLLDSELKTAIDYGIGGVPETIYVGADGLVKSVDRGGLTRERLSAGLKTIGVEF